MSDIGYKVLDRIYSIRGVKRFKLISRSEILDYTTLTFAVEIEYTEATKYLLQINLSKDEIISDVSIPESDIHEVIKF